MSGPDPVPEARLVETDAGLVPEGEGWFILNVADSAAVAVEGAGHAWLFENPDGVKFPHFGINVQVLEPGEPSALYHAEEAQEAFLVLQGECLLLVEEQERTLRQWDFFHAAPWTKHIFVGAGESPCAILMAGARLPGDRVHYPVSELARRHGAGVEVATDSAEEAYPSVGWDRPTPARRPWPPA
jgi:uncharacterized cupin superfamily protein